MTEPLVKYCFAITKTITNTAFTRIVLCLLIFGGCAQPSHDTVSLPLSAIRCLTNVEEIRDIACENEHIIWSATPGGLLRLDRRSGQWAVFTAASGLPSNNISALLYSSSGILWIGTDRGVVSFSNRAFTVSGGTLDELPPSAITVLADGIDGTIYAGTERGIARFTGEKTWEPFNDAHEFARRRVRDIARDSDGSMWFAKENALSHYRRDGKWEVFYKDIKLSNEKVGLFAGNLLSIAVDDKGAKWIGTVNGLNSYDGIRWHNYYNRERIAVKSGLQCNWIETVAVGPENKIWVAHGDSGSMHAPSGAGFMTGTDSWSYLTTADGLPSNRVYKLRQGPKNTMWIGTANGLACVAGGTVQAFVPPRILPDNHVISLISDSDSVYAVLPHGIIEYASGTMRELPELNSTLRAGVAVDGTIYTAGVEKGLYILHKKNEWTVDDFFSGKTILYLEKEKNGKVFAVCRDGMYYGKPGNWSKVALPALPTDVHLLKTFRAPDGNLWITGERVVRDDEGRAVFFIYSAGKLSQVDVPSLSSSYARLNSIIFDREGNPCLVSPAGVYKYRSGWQELKMPMPKGGIYAALWDASGRFWAGGRECGLFMHDGKTWHEILFNGSPAPGWITSLQVQGNDTLWIGTADQGVFRIDLKGIL